MSFLWQSLCKGEADTAGDATESSEVPPLTFCSLKFTSQALPKAESPWAGHKWLPPKSAHSTLELPPMLGDELFIFFFHEPICSILHPHGYGSH